jgi:hypothetical protein
VGRRWTYCSRVDDDLQRPPSDADRAALVTRINRVHDEGRISTADRDIRLGNVRSAQSGSELDLMGRDLDQLEAALPAGGEVPASPYGAFDPKAGVRAEPVTVEATPKRMVLALVLVVVLVLVGVAALFVVGFRVSRDSEESPSASPGAPVSPATDPATPPDDPQADPPAGSSYSLGASGIRSFLATYRKKFGTSQVVDLTFYGDYVIVDVPVPGKARQSGWLYRRGTWTTFGGVRATFPGSQAVDTNRLDVPALARNIVRAKRTLNVEQAQSYVIIRFIPQTDDAPRVNVYATNEFHESGYLSTTLDGKVLRTYAYDR